jgi:YidC/Oxa1 family membrane protein insertase
VPNDPQGATRSFVAYTIAMPGAASMQYFIGPKDFDVLRQRRPAARPRLCHRLRHVPGHRRAAAAGAEVDQQVRRQLRLVDRHRDILINLAIFPLRHRSMVSMRKMQAIQPEMKAIQDRYKNLKVTDPERQKMNTEMMALYKQRGREPGRAACLPMLLTLPILFALYAMLSVAIELRGAPLFRLDQDLSHFDPWYVTPVLMGGTMFLQQRMMPSNADPVQQKCSCCCR